MNENTLTIDMSNDTESKSLTVTAAQMLTLANKYAQDLASYYSNKQFEIEQFVCHGVMPTGNYKNMPERLNRFESWLESVGAQNCGLGTDSYIGFYTNGMFIGIENDGYAHS